ncbi:MAG: hypothetical protein SNF33_01310 [Candidatus Algichlamydia australiensis]|nr:hypothetical protein [Chlamydiales bacterium]
MLRLILPLFLAIPLFSMTIKERLRFAHEGQYIVTEQSKLVTFMRIQSLTDKRVVLEEISIPSHKAKKINWRSWYRDGTPGATSHLLYEIDLARGVCTNAYSPQREVSLNSSAQQLFTDLIALPLKAVREKDRKRIGAPPQEGLDMRKIWNPPLFQNGKKLTKIATKVYKAHWPDDGTELAGKNLELYFHEGSPFPCWMEISNSAATFKIRLIDSGDA